MKDNDKLVSEIPLCAANTPHLRRKVATVFMFRYDVYMKSNDDIDAILAHGEGFQIEFKEKLANLDREIVAFANSNGGSIWLGVNDAGKIVGIDITNRLKSQLIDIARNCDPSIPVDLHEYPELKLLELIVQPGLDKPYRSRDGFFIRVGANSQKLKRDEILKLINESGVRRFDDTIHPSFQYPDDFSSDFFAQYLKLCNIESKAPTDDLLISLNVAKHVKGQLQFNNAGVLFFAKKPQNFFPESFITCVKYNSFDRFSIVDKKDFYGTPFMQIEGALNFLVNYIPVQTVISAVASVDPLGQRKELYDYPLMALREAVINAAAHRDYWYDGSHIYIHMYPDRIEIESPGGLYHGIDLASIEWRSIRRNPLIADLLHRAGYIERVGSGFTRMKHALRNNGNPELELAASNFFNVRFRKRALNVEEITLTPRQQLLLQAMREAQQVTVRQAADVLNVSEDTARRELTELIKKELVLKEGVGRATSYRVNT